MEKDEEKKKLVFYEMVEKNLFCFMLFHIYLFVHLYYGWLKRFVVVVVICKQISLWNKSLILLLCLFLINKRNDNYNNGWIKPWKKNLFSPFFQIEESSKKEWNVN